jgi:stage II sporulation protein M
MGEELELREYLHSLRFYILFVCILFAGAIAMGYMGFLSEVFSESLAWLEQLSEGVVDFTELYPSWILFIAFFFVIFLNNAFTCFLNIILGPPLTINLSSAVHLGIYPLFSVVINGGLLGWLAREEGLFVFLAIVPHGVFELPAYFLSVAIGLKLAQEIFIKNEKEQSKTKLEGNLKVYLRLIVPLLFVAALIESGLIVLSILLIP